ncbi:methyltransferase domain-containing protein [Pseudoalteromonas peptidolytica]|uniref:methyltransferase domain-containing protein n=1 Tax=Pseudoalteromonas peptidolytica TaxID=61150 RepID=UPI00298E1864|nr:methyltransferase domain-containing protein [Pseudoalteromonas peptidolytica]MDW7550049.1 methyltransferase domain-containing protein [Pseudoalteromonas peptidolytica]
MKILLVPIEFTTWEQARAWSYTGSYAFSDGLTENNIEHTFAPIFIDKSGKVNTICLDYIRENTSEKFDQVWVWCIHGALPSHYWEWFSSVANISVGILMESLIFEEDELLEFPNLRNRRALALEQLKNFDKAFVCSEADANVIRSEIGIDATWYPPMMPEKYIDFRDPPETEYAVFVGSNYGKRRKFLSHSQLRKKLKRPHLPERDTELPYLFDKLIDSFPDSLDSDLALDNFMTNLRAIRGALFELHLEGLRMGCANVNLPSILKAFAGRVIESMGASVPVITWIPPGKEQKSLFTINEDILAFSSIDGCLEAINQVNSDKFCRENITITARNKVLTRHTSRIRIKQLLNWIENGKAIDYSQDLTYRPSVEESLYYKELFTKNPSWNRFTPNTDESCRWKVIDKYLSRIHTGSTGESLIADVGCGRGWLSSLMVKYGKVTAVDPIGDVIDFAKSSFEHINFVTGSSDLLEFLGLKDGFDVVVSSEVIEHIPPEQKLSFVKSLVQICKPGGFLIISTPRKDILADWIEEYGVPNQPTEDWLYERDLIDLFTSSDCTVVSLERAFLMDIYQIHLFRKNL